MLGGNADEDAGVGLEGRAVIDDGAAAEEEDGDVGEVHDPARGGVLQRDAVWAEALVEDALLVVVDHDAADRVDDGLGGTRRAGRVADEEGFVKAEADKLGRRESVSRSDKRLPRLRLGDARHITGLIKPANRHHASKVGASLQPLHNLGHLLPEINHLAVVQRSIIHKQQLPLNISSAPPRPHQKEKENSPSD